MTRFAALLRGINVGKARRVPMADLRELLSEWGATDVKTLLNSGNATFEIHHSPKTIDEMLTRLISDRFGFEVEVTCRSQKQLEKALTLDPLQRMGQDDSHYVIAFLPTRPSPTKLKPVLAAEYGNDEECAVSGREFYAWCPNGLNENQTLKALAKSGATPFATARNVRTVQKLIDQMSAA
jgi:uncharacterized protein (DUF1697 family)